MEMITTQNAPQVLGSYSQAVAVNNFVFLSGQIPLNPESMEIVGDTITSQTKQVMRNIKAVLKASGLALDNVVKTTVFLTNISDFHAMNVEYEKQFRDHKPARSTIAVSALPKGSLIEIECIAIRE